MQNCHRPPFFRFSNVEECGKTIAAASFEQVTIAEVPQVWRFPSPAGFFDGISASTVRTAALPCAQTAENLARIRAAAEGEARNYSLADGTITTMRTQRVQRNLRRSRP